MAPSTTTSILPVLAAFNKLLKQADRNSSMSLRASSSSSIVDGMSLRASQELQARAQILRCSEPRSWKPNVAPRSRGIHYRLSRAHRLRYGLPAGAVLLQDSALAPSAG